MASGAFLAAGAKAARCAPRPRLGRRVATGRAALVSRRTSPGRDRRRAERLVLDEPALEARAAEVGQDDVLLAPRRDGFHSPGRCLNLAPARRDGLGGRPGPRSAIRRQANIGWLESETDSFAAFAHSRNRAGSRPSAPLTDATSSSERTRRAAIR